jgi:uncharacterized protein YecT (DUF1311 family)
LIEVKYGFRPETEIPMHVGNVRMWTLTLCASSVLSLLILGQQGPTNPTEGPISEQGVYGQSVAQRRGLQARAKQVFDTEMAREKMGDCPDAKSDYEFNVCFGKQLAITDENLNSYEGFIRELIALPPQVSGKPAVEGNLPANGMAGPVLTSSEFEHEFERVEQSWGQYREVACSAAFHQFDGGTGGPSFQLQYKLKLARDYMRELNMIYGEDLHL